MNTDNVLHLLTIAAAIGGSYRVAAYRLGRTELQLNEAWAKIHALEKAQQDHKIESLEERLKIQEQFTQQALTQNTLAGEVKLAVAVMERVEEKVEGISKELMRS